MSLGAMLGVAALLVSTSLPANAFFNATATTPGAATTEHVPVQLMNVEPSVVVSTAARDSYTVIPYVKKVVVKVASRGSTLYTNDPNGTIQWPFPVPVPIASGFGPREVAGCSYCSTFHEGLDFTPGSGVPIHAIADGVVSLVQQDSGGLGNHIMIDHLINGQKVQSVYAHMLTGSVTVVVGQQVKVTDVVGAVGSTGASTGAHLHLEIHLGGAPVDPFAWLKANAN
jgi:murein DD-endopeptidase MepM/ murein hydrolase activator NlpD